MTYREKTRDGVTRITGSTSGSQGPQGEPGPQGEEGPPGPQGPGSERVDFTFTVASLTWTLVHNLGILRVDVITTDGVGDEIEGEIDYVDANTVIIRWYFPMTGTATVRN